ncbi:MAG TPA: hypothetical protein VFX33_13770 [Actinomycetales bacterium]|nr:hypothetical protein [Actinomycetales bacterium]
MSIPFGAQLIGQTEKTLNALLHAVLGGRLTEPQWVTLRLAHLLEQQIDSSEALVEHVADRARYDDAAVLVEGLAASGLLRRGRLTDEGRAVVAEIQARIGERTAQIWADLPPDDVAAATRVLNEVLGRARAALA